MFYAEGVRNKPTGKKIWYPAEIRTQQLLNTSHTLLPLRSPETVELEVNSEMFTASTNTVNFKFVGILGNGVCALRLVCLEDTDYLKNAKDGQECVYHSVHMPLWSITT